MALHCKASEEEEEQEEEAEVEEQFSSDDGSFDEDMEALRRACLLTGTDAADLDRATTATDNSSAAAATTSAAADSEDDFDDLEFVRSIQQRFHAPPLSLKSPSSIPTSVSDEEEDDFETLRAIQRRFATYGSDNLRISTENDLQKHEQVRVTGITSEKETSSNLYVSKTNSCEACPDFEDTSTAAQNLEFFGDKVPRNKPSGSSEWNRTDAHEGLNHSNFPMHVQLFVDAIKKNRSCQKFIRSKLIHIEAKLEENKKLKERFKVLKDFQVSCRKRTGRALSQKKNPSVQLVSVQKMKASKNSKVGDKKVHAMYRGPAENSHVANYTMALTKFPLSLDREKWLNKERENLQKGIKQQFQQMSFQMSVELCSGAEGSFGDAIDFDAIMSSIADFEITPEHIKLFLPKVNWEQLASMNVVGRSGAECETRWLNWENPLINQSQWTSMEDRKLLHMLQQKGCYNWIDIAQMLGTNRTPFQCLARFQRSLNAFIIRTEWTDDEDAELRKAVETFGEGDWQHIASTLEGRTGTQCSNRWKKSLHPKRKGVWTQHEDKCLTIAVMLLGPKTWNKIAAFVPGRGPPQCRERWVNTLNPSLNVDGVWTEEEDSRLIAACTQYAHCWSKVAKCVPPRTDSQCLRRWKKLFPHEVTSLQQARKIRKAALISNFVDRESERPALGPNDFLPLPALDSISPPENTNPCARRKKKSLRMLKSECTAFENVPKRTRSKRPRKAAQFWSEYVPIVTEYDQAGTSFCYDVMKKSATTLHSKMNDPPLFCPDSTALMISNGEQVEGIEAFDGDITKKEEARQQHSERDKLQGADTIGRDDLTLKNTRIRKPSSKKRNKCTRPVQEHSSPCGDSSLPATVNSGEVEACGKDDARRKKMAHRQTSRRRCGELEKLGGDGFILMKKTATNSCSKTNESTEPIKDHSPPCPDSSMLMTNGEEVETFGGDLTKKEETHKRHSKRDKLKGADTIGRDALTLKNIRMTKPSSKKRNKCIRPVQDHSSPFWDSSLSTTMNSGEVEACGKVDVSEKNSATVDMINASLNEEPSGVCQQDRPKRLITGDEPGPNQVSGLEDDDDMTLVSFVRIIKKKRKVKHMKRGNLAYSPHQV
ncbi:uncharacterized protein LOC131146820 [Malania oleifera]|uniref:uncharacterized protein LOC131146820 n=1 Tax=Malania oleifera TaxID=397392 RepID=UPI0025AE3005|nr:uncharacterized protein LOC131146820 [Malania oleifera]